MRGVLLIAVGHPYYGNYAENLCMSLKSVCPDVKVSLAHDSGAIGHISHNHNFDSLIEIPKEYIYTNGIKDYLKAKVFLYNLSPYDETIFIDADVIWCPQKPINNLFEEFKDIDFTCSNKGRVEIEKAQKGFIHWADPKDIMEMYYVTTGWLYNLASEFIYFKKCDEISRLFKDAQTIYETPLINFTRFGMNMPDELPFEIACLMNNIYPHKDHFNPFYWEHFEKKNLPPHNIYKNYYGYSIGGNVTSKSSSDVYNNLAQHYSKQFGKEGFFPVKDKKSWLPERAQI